jgi:hypothetical protein
VVACGRPDRARKESEKKKTKIGIGVSATAGAGEESEAGAGICSCFGEKGEREEEKPGRRMNHWCVAYEWLAVRSGGGRKAKRGSAPEKSL